MHIVSLTGENAGIPTCKTERHYVKHPVVYRVFSPQGRVAHSPHYYRSQDGHYVSLIRNARVFVCFLKTDFLTLFQLPGKCAICEISPFVFFSLFFMSLARIFCCVTVTNLLP